MSGRVLLLFPPLNPLITHPELGLAQLKAWLQSEGHTVRHVDLNAAFLGPWLMKPAVADAILAEADSDTRSALLRLPGRMHGRAERLVRYLRRMAPGGMDRRDAESWTRRLLDHVEATLPPAELSASDRSGPAAGAQTGRGLLRGLLDDPRFVWATWTRFAGMARDVLFRSGDWTGAGIRAAVEKPLPVFDRFLERFLEPALASRPDLVGLSVHAADQLVGAMRVAAWLKERIPGIPVVIGGPWCTVAADVIRTDPVLFEWVDRVILHEGEQPLSSALSGLEKGGTLPESIPGTLALTGELVVHTEAEHPVSLDLLPAPDFSDVHWRLYPEKKVPFRTIRGCTWGRCVFCYHVFGPRTRPPAGLAWPDALTEKLLATLDAAREQGGIRRLTLADNATPTAHLEAAARALLDRDAEWEAMARFEEGLTPEVCRQLYRGGCRDLSFGLETSAASELARIKKGIDLDRVDRCLDACAAAGIRAHVFALDYPSQRGEVYQETLDFLTDRHRVVETMIPQRFRLGRNSGVFKEPSILDILVTRDADRWFDVFDVPFKPPRGWSSEEVFRRTTERALLRFILAKGTAEEPG